MARRRDDSGRQLSFESLLAASAPGEDDGDLNDKAEPTRLNALRWRQTEIEQALTPVEPEPVLTPVEPEPVPVEPAPDTAGLVAKAYPSRPVLGQDRARGDDRGVQPPSPAPAPRR